MVHKRMGMPFQPQHLPLVNYSLWSSLIIDSIDGRWMLTKTQAELFSKFFLAEVNRGHSKLSGPKKWNLTLYLIMRERPRRSLAEALLSSIDKRDESNPTDRYCKHFYDSFSKKSIKWYWEWCVTIWNCLFCWKIQRSMFGKIFGWYHHCIHYY